MTTTDCVPTLVGVTYTIGSWSASDANPGVTDAAGNKWHITSEIGLMHSPAPRTNVVDREQSDGVFDGDTWLPGRSVVLEGVVRSPDFPTLYTAMRTLRGLLTAGSRRLPLVAAFPDLTLQTVVRRDGETLVDKLPSPRHPTATFSLVLYAPDPNLYGGTVQSASTGASTPSGGRAYNWAPPRAYGGAGTAGLITVTNNGDATTYPIITISAGSGPLVNPVITIPGGLGLVFNLTLNAGDVLVIDTGARTVVLNGTAPRTWPLTSGTLGAGPGNTQYLFTATTADPTALMSVSWRDAYQ